MKVKNAELWRNLGVEKEEIFIILLLFFLYLANALSNSFISFFLFSKCFSFLLCKSGKE